MNQSQRYRPLMAQGVAAVTEPGMSLIASKVCPFRQVTTLEGTFKKFDLSRITRVANVERGFNEAAKEKQWGTTLDTYDCHGKGLRTPYSNTVLQSEVNKGYDPATIMMNGAEVLARDIRKANESAVATLLRTQANYSGNVIDVVNTYSHGFDDATQSPNVLKVIHDAMDMCYGNVTDIAMSSTTYSVLAYNAWLVGRIVGGGGNNPGFVDVDTMRTLFFRGGAGNLWIGSGYYNAAKKDGESNISRSYFWGDDIILMAHDPAALVNPELQTFAVNFAFQQEIGDGITSDTTDYFVVREYDDPGAASGGAKVIEVEQAVDPKIINGLYGVLITNTMES